MNRNLILMLICLTYWLPAWADIIFIDVNDSITELKQATKIAKELGVKLWIVPSRSDAADLSKDLAHTLATMVKENKTLDSMVVSGHYNGSKFYGDKGKSITPFQIQQIFSRPEFKGKQNELQNLLLWGCYSARPIAMDFWTRLFPNMQTLTGFNFAAPSWRTEAGPNLMYDVLSRFSRAMTNEKLKAQIEEVSNSYAFKITHAVIYHEQCYESSTLGEIELNSSIECPDTLIQGLKKRAKIMYYPHLKLPTSISKTESAKICTHSGASLGRFCIDALRYTRCFDESNQLPHTSEIHDLCRKYGCSW